MTTIAAHPSSYADIFHDIRYQLIKDDNRKSSFAMSEQWFVRQNETNLKKINTMEKQMSADHHCQEAGYLKNLARLLNREKSLDLEPSWCWCLGTDKEKKTSRSSMAGSVSTSDKDGCDSRKHSFACEHQTQLGIEIPRHPNGGHPRRRQACTQSTSWSPHPDTGSDFVAMTSRDCRSKRRVLDTAKFQVARRMSHDVQEETARLSLVKLKALLVRAEDDKIAGAPSKLLMEPKCCNNEVADHKFCY